MDRPIEPVWRVILFVLMALLLPATAAHAAKRVALVIGNYANCWPTIRAHVGEVFFGDIRGLAAVLNAASGVQGHLYRLEEKFFADEPREQLIGPTEVSPDKLYGLLVAVAS